MDTADYLKHIPHREIRKRWVIILDQAETVLRRHTVRMTSFLTPGEWGYAHSLLCHYPGLRWVLEGGYRDAERRRLIMMPDDQSTEDLPAATALVKVSCSTRMKSLTHRNCLGAVLSCGIEREMVGDILICHPGAYVVLVPELRDYLLSNLDLVGSTRVTLEETPEMPPEAGVLDVEVIKGTVASLRLDAVLSVALRIPRQKAQALIGAQKVRINWQPVQKKNVPIHAQDVVSIQGYGRIKLLKIGDPSRSQRWHIEIGSMK